MVFGDYKIYFQLGWTSLQEIIDEFDLEASIDDPSAIDAEIRIKLTSAHPYKSGV
tara:strand:- start:70353 stop:70517 length:165 start_codon:yes stop_codon:yes gene_type:complete